jgi:hypothetical protein
MLLPANEKTKRVDRPTAGIALPSSVLRSLLHESELARITLGYSEDTKKSSK